ncbi:MAG: ribbon-helix-helix domain-containing protein [Thermofilum sp.]|uniref:ribbon-helix-helix domain-containing protein n=1 Tax=Thermofilum sp. TaxID=1961369 RepID=UPI0031792A8A
MFGAVLVGKIFYMYTSMYTCGFKGCPVRLGEDELKKIDVLVKYGVFRSRSEAIRELVRLGVKLAYVSEVLEAVERLFELEKVEGRIPVELGGATRQLLEERER